MKKEISDFFLENKIEYFAALDYNDAREISPEIMQRESFSPKSVIVFLIPYYAGKTNNLSVYAASLDYHLCIREISDKLTELMKEIYPANSFKAYGDHSPIDEVGAAITAGLGIKGDSGLFINEKYGTYVFVADIVSDIEPSELGTVKSGWGECIHCGKCKSACPTGILRGEGRDCLSAVTQRKGELSEEEISLMKTYNTVWGCDVCQSVCPYNENPILTPIEFFYKDIIDTLTSEVLNNLTKEEFKKRAFGWRGRATVERNLQKLGY